MSRGWWEAPGESPADNRWRSVAAAARSLAKLAEGRCLARHPGDGGSAAVCRRIASHDGEHAGETDTGREVRWRDTRGAEWRVTEGR